MILLDLNQTVIASLMMQIGSNPKVQIDEDLVRHIVLNCIRSYSKQFRSKYGKMVICCDNKNYWRREVFPFYKSHRRKDREKSDFDWNLIFNTLNKIKAELKDFAPYSVLEVESCEADDIIAVITEKQAAENEAVLILSSDKDFVQLQKFDNVKQYSPILKRFISSSEPDIFTKEHILRGDRGDGIPNFLSPDNTFAMGEKQKRINTKKLTEWLSSDPNDFCTTDEMKRGYSRNKQLIDFDSIPSNLKTKILEEYEKSAPKRKQVFLDYLIEKKMRMLIADLEDF